MKRDLFEKAGVFLVLFLLYLGGFAVLHVLLGVSAWQFVATWLTFTGVSAVALPVFMRLDRRQRRQRQRDLIAETIDKLPIESSAMASMHDCPDGPTWSYMTGLGWQRGPKESCEDYHARAEALGGDA